MRKTLCSVIGALVILAGGWTGAEATGRRAPADRGLAERIRWCESTDNYLDYNRSSTASGAYQELDSTWRSWARAYGAEVNASRWARAAHAPPEVQELVARRVLAAQGTRPWSSSSGCWGSGVARHHRYRYHRRR